MHRINIHQFKKRECWWRATLGCCIWTTPKWGEVWNLWFTSDGNRKILGQDRSEIFSTSLAHANVILSLKIEMPIATPKGDTLLRWRFYKLGNWQKLADQTTRYMDGNTAEFISSRKGWLSHANDDYRIKPRTPIHKYDMTHPWSNSLPTKWPDPSDGHHKPSEMAWHIQWSPQTEWNGLTHAMVTTNRVKWPDTCNGHHKPSEMAWHMQWSPQTEWNGLTHAMVTTNRVKWPDTSAGLYTRSE